MPATLSLGINFAEPWKFPIHAASNEAGVSVYLGAGSGTPATNASFWTEINGRGTATNANFTANTYSTIFTDTGKGLIATIIGPAASNNGTTTFEITVDGALVEVPVTVLAGQRAILGLVTANGVFTAAATQGLNFGTFDANKITQSVGAIGANSIILPNWHSIYCLGMPCLQYNTGFTLRVKHSADISDTANQGRQCGLIHRRAAY
jgi:hypothetical protein